MDVQRLRQKPPTDFQESLPLPPPISESAFFSFLNFTIINLEVAVLRQFLIPIDLDASPPG